ncbi:MAG: pyrroline-5-carboxylate reductase [Arcanobacterium sp.]|nr:pyrroline-5-carboxylate reductase [Arcanobacterium sp.]
MLGFIGAGSMGGAVMRGVLQAGLYAPEEIIFTRTNPEKAAQFSTQTGVAAASSNSELIRALGEGGIVILGVKPYQVREVLAEISEDARKLQTLIVSIAGGTPLAKLGEPLDQAQAIVRTMPNVNSAIQMGMTALCPNSRVSTEQLAKVEQIFQAVGETVVIKEADFGAFSAIAGCSPAWTFTFIDALSRGALAAGLTKEAAVKIAAQAVAGSAMSVLQALPEVRPQALVDSVTSPGGTTIAGLIAAERAGFSNSVVAAVEAAIARDTEISAQK